MSTPTEPTTPRGDGPAGQVVDATRRTHLATERTYLAWLRTGLTAFAVAIAVGKLVPALTDESEGAYAVAGIGFALLGIAVIVFGLVRLVAVERALARGGYAPAGITALTGIAVAAVALGIALAALLVVYI